jgi:hypothetical protein
MEAVYQSFLLATSHITVHGIGMQQHSTPSHSKHLALPAVPLSGLTIEPMVEEAAEPGPLRLTIMNAVELHIAPFALERRRLVLVNGRRSSLIGTLRGRGRHTDD